MKNRISAACLLVAFAAFAAAGCSTARKSDAPHGPVKTYSMRGEVLGLDGGKVVTMKHEKIEGLMEGMTMGYQVKDPAEFAKLAVGAHITATVNVSDDDMWLSNIQKDTTAPDSGAPKP